MNNRPSDEHIEHMVRQWVQASRFGRTGYRAEHDEDDAAHLYLYDAISWFAISASDFVREISAVDSDRIVLHINSPGGDIFDAVAIYNALRDHRAHVETRVDGIAASAASFVAQAGDRVVMAKHSMMMIHDPWGITIGDARDHRNQADVLDQLGDNIASIYAERAGGSSRTWRDRMLEETWYTDREAVDAGLADEVAGDEATENRFDLSGYRKAPDEVRRPAARLNHREPTERDIEQALRDAGLSRKAAKALIAGGWSAVDESARDASGLEELLAVVRQMKAA